jgi:hypothetical protein
VRPEPACGCALAAACWLCCGRCTSEMPPSLERAAFVACGLTVVPIRPTFLRSPSNSRPMCPGPSGRRFRGGRPTRGPRTQGRCALRNWMQGGGGKGVWPGSGAAVPCGPNLAPRQQIDLMMWARPHQRPPHALSLPEIKIIRQKSRQKPRHPSCNAKPSAKTSSPYRLPRSQPSQTPATLSEFSSNKSSHNAPRCPSRSRHRGQ